MELASRRQRLGAVLIDMGIGVVYAIPLFYLFGGFRYVNQRMAEPTSTKIVIGVLGFVLFILVHAYFLKNDGQTIGKKLVGIKIVDLNNNVPGLWKIITMRYLPMEAALIPVLGPIFGLVDSLLIFRADRRCAHDHIAGTKVVKKRSALPPLPRDGVADAPRTKLAEFP